MKLTSKLIAVIGTGLVSLTSSLSAFASQTLTLPNLSSPLTFTNVESEKYRDLAQQYEQLPTDKLAKEVKNLSKTQAAQDFNKISPQLDNLLVEKLSNRNLDYRQYLNVIFSVLSNINLRYSLTETSYTSQSMEQFVSYYLACSTYQDRTQNNLGNCNNVIRFGNLMLNDPNFMETLGLLSLYQGFNYNQEKGSLSLAATSKLEILKSTEFGKNLSRDFYWQPYSYKQYYTIGGPALSYLKTTYGIQISPGLGNYPNLVQ
ncbi:hypothetical protein CJP74_01825 [Psittacicella melopsittaci]|uniref:Uncharacterized protein n=1 Tax=Psittacicella melopsittaci TaxID=2028576 RepID=A0A3A1Y8E6_9GAMM|nr:hypothetical protein [Psittacicella melopsittaci]RIY33489.1 hypothetical protein CJP74_01825 [Psittacicella melopsittaci]